MHKWFLGGKTLGPEKLGFELEKTWKANQNSEKTRKANQKKNLNSKHETTTDPPKQEAYKTPKSWFDEGKREKKPGNKLDKTPENKLEKSQK